MKKDSVVLVDSYDDYRWVLANFLTGNGVLVSGSFNHDLFLKQTTCGKFDIAIISYSMPKYLTEQSISFLRRNYPSVKILINSIFEDKKSIDKIIRMEIDGLVFKMSKDHHVQILQAINALKENKIFFV